MPQNAELEFDLLDRLRKAMRVAGKDAGDLAADLGVHRNTVGNYLNGRTPVDRRTLVTWAVSTGVPLPWLETGATSDVGTPGPGSSTPDDRQRRLNRLAERKRNSSTAARDSARYAA